MSTETENGMPLISDMFGQMMFLMPSAGVSEHPVKISQSQERQIANTVTTRNTVNGLTNIKQDGTAVCIPVLTPDRAEKRQNGRRMKDNGDEAFTLTSQDIHGVAVSEERAEIPVIWYDKYNCYIAIRKLTPRECFRLQGWTDDYFEKAEFVNSDSQLYKQAGNGVTVNVVYEIGKVIRDNE